MAGRIRSVMREILDDERSAGLSSEAWRLWVSMWLLADDHGRLRGAPVWLQGQVFWATTLQAPITTLLAELAAAQVIVRYETDGQSYIEVRNWKKHQKVDRPSAPRIPEPTPAQRDESIMRVIGSRELRESLAAPSRDPRVDLATDPDHRSPISDLDHRPADSKQSAVVVQPGLALDVSAPSPPRFDFEGVYKAHWIRKEGKQDGMAICARDIRSEADFQQWTRAVKNYAALMLSERREILRQKHFSSFMGCWRDYIEFVPPPSGVIDVASDEKGRSLF